MKRKFSNNYSSDRESEFYTRLNQVEEKLTSLLEDDEKMLLESGVTLEELVKNSELPKKIKDAYSEILHHVEPYSAKIFWCEVLILELRRY